MPQALRVLLELLPGRAVMPVGVVGQSFFARWRGLDEFGAVVATTGPGLRARRPDGSAVTLPLGDISALGGEVWGADIILDAPGRWIVEASVTGPVAAYDQETARCVAGVIAGDAWPAWVAAADSAAAAAASAAAAAASAGGGAGGAVTSVAGREGAVVLSAADISGLGRARLPPAALVDASTTILNNNISDDFTWTMAGNRTLALSNIARGRIVNVEIKQDTPGSRLITWPAGFTWPGGSVPVLSTASNATDLLTFRTLDGTTYRATLAKGFA